MSTAPKMRGVTLRVLVVAALSVSTVGPVLAAQSRNGAGDVSKTYPTKTGKTIVVSQSHRAGRSLATIEVRTEGFDIAPGLKCSAER